jgi:hypothetical protein
MGSSAHELPNKNYQLWTHGGTNGVFIKNCRKNSPEIEIPSLLLRMLVAEDIRSAKMRQLESLTTDEVLGLYDPTGR